MAPADLTLPARNQVGLVRLVADKRQPVTGELAALDAEISFLDDVLDDLEVRSIAPSTRRSYTATWAEFTLWCERFGFESLPADPITVRRFIADLSIQLREDGTPRFTTASIRQKMSAIAWHHGNAGHLDPTSHKLIARTIAGLARKRQEKVVRKRPLLLDDLLTVIDATEHDVYPAGVSAARDTLALWLGWAAALRRSEAAALTFGQIELHPHDGLWITVGRSKTNQDGAGSSLVAIPYGSAPRTCVACAYVHWARLVAVSADPELDAAAQRRETMRILFNHQTFKAECTTHVCRAGLPDSPALGAGQPLLRATYRNRKTATIVEPTWDPGDPDAGEEPRLHGVTGNALGEMILTRLDEAGYRADLYGYHSLRSGLVTQARRNGASSRAVRRITRQRSDATVEIYDREWNPLEGSAHAEHIGL